MPYTLAITEGDLLAGMADGRILRSGDRGENWDELELRVESIIAMAAAE
jgi:hypothetical protein